MPKPKTTQKTIKSRHDPLGSQLCEEKFDKMPKRKSKTKKKSNDCKEAFLSERMSRKVLEQARAQQMDIEGGLLAQYGHNSSHSMMNELFEEDEDGCIVEDGVALEEDGEYVVADESELDPADLRAMNMFMGDCDNNNNVEGDDMAVFPRRTLADIIMEKIREKEDEAKELDSNMEDEGRFHRLYCQVRV